MKADKGSIRSYAPTDPAGPGADAAVERDLWELSIDMLATASLDGYLTRVSPSWQDALGYTPEELMARPYLDFVHPDDVAATLAEARKLLVPDHSTVSFENRYRAKDGSYRWLLWNSRTSADGSSIYCVVRDISERRRAQAEIEHSKTLLADLLDSAPDAVVIADEHGQITLVNERSERLFGYDRAELVGAPIERLLPRGVPERNVDNLDAPATRTTGVGLDLAGRHKDGTEFPVDITSSAIKTDSGRLVTAFIRDITERKRTEDDLADVHQKALEVSRLKSEFVANMSHEIRTPLNGVLGMSGLLLESELTEEQRECADAVQASGGALMTVIEDILDFSKIEAGKLELDSEPFDLREMIDDASAMVATAANAKGIELMTWVDDGFPDAVSGDAPRLRQILVNLLTNAVKFTQAGEVVVQVTEQPAVADRLGLRFEVSDTGIGIDHTSLGRIFDSFSQADSSTTRRYGGTGLGLPISKSIVDLMGGEIGVESTPGQGSTFWFTVALDVAENEAVAPEPRGLDRVRALVVDDNATNRTFVERRLASWGMTCETAADAGAALVILHKAADSGRPHRLAVLDSKMPQMNGLELVAAIKASPALRSVRLLVLAHSGDVRAEAVEAGVDGFVTKPVRQSRLREEITRVLGARGAQPLPIDRTSSKDSVEGGSSSRRPVLVAEDNPVNQLVATRLLEKRGLQVDVAANGREAVEMHRCRDYEVIFMDCQMPELDGYQATAEIRRREGSDRHTPIIAVTAHTLKGDRERCLDAGMDDYLGKPLSPALLDEILARSLWPREAPPGQDAGIGAADEEGDLDIDGIDDRPLVLDTRLLVEVCDGDAQVREQLVSTFLEQGRSAIAELAGALAAGDAAGAQRVAHTLKGSSAVVGAERLSAIASRICVTAAAGRLTDAVPHQAELGGVFAMTAAALNSNQELEVLP